MHYAQHKWRGIFAFNTHLVADCEPSFSGLDVKEPHCFDRRYLEQFCHKKQFQLAKVLRIRLSLLESLLTDER